MISTPLSCGFIVIAASLLFTGCESIAKPAVQGQKAPVEKASSSERFEHLKMQKFCSEAGDKFWKELMQSPRDPKLVYTDQSYTTHYNEAVNKCIVEVSYSTMLGQTKMDVNDFYDALGRLLLGTEGMPADDHKVTFWILKGDQNLANTEENRKSLENLMTK